MTPPDVLLLLRRLGRERLLLAALGMLESSGRDNTDTRSECFVSLLFSPGAWFVCDFDISLSPVRIVDCVKVDWLTSDVKSESTTLELSSDRIVDSSWSPLVGGGSLGAASGIEDDSVLSG